MRLRHARLAQEITLKQLALKVGCSESLLSKLENEVASPSLAMLHRVASALETSISDLMAENWVADSPVVKAEQRVRKRFVHRNKKGGLSWKISPITTKGVCCRATSISLSQAWPVTGRLSIRVRRWAMCWRGKLPST